MVYVDEESKRFWIIKVNKPQEDDPLFFEKLEKEIPAVLYYLKNRPLATERETRMHFNHEWIKTDALKETVKINEPQDVSNVRELVKSMFLDIPKHGDQILMPMKYVIQEFFKKGIKESWAKEVLRDFLGVTLLTNPETGKWITKRGEFSRKNIEIVKDENTGESNSIERLEKIIFNGRPYVFNKSDFVNDDEIPEEEKPNDILKGQEHLLPKDDDD